MFRRLRSRLRCSDSTSLQESSLPRLWRSVDRVMEFKRARSRLLRIESLEDRRLLTVEAQGIPNWIEQGPGPITLSSGFIQAGAIEAIAVDPGNSDRVFVGTVNGGIWRTNTGTYSPSDGVDNDNDTVVDGPNESPSWEALTDQFGSLSISAIAISPSNPNVIYAGTGRTSAGFGDGGSFIGVLRSTDGGDTWMQVGPELVGSRIRSIVPTGQNDPGTGQEIVLVASDQGVRGVFRSIDAGLSFTQVSGVDGTSDGIDNDNDGTTDESNESQAASHLVADPGNPSRYYAAIPQVGVFRSDDTGSNWMPINGTGGNVITGIAPANFRTELAVHNFAGNNVVYAAIIRNDVVLPSPPFNPRTNRVFAMFRSTDMGANWRQIQNMPVINPGAQAGAHFSMIAHPTNPNVIFVGGDAPDGSLAPPQMTRYRAAMNDAAPATDAWQLVADSGTINNTRPHADSRDFAFALDANGNLSMLNADDGGIYRLFDPDNGAANRRWESINGDIRVTESYSLGYDSLNNTITTGTQDNGTARQRDNADALFPFDWNNIQGGDGAVITVDNDQVAHPGETIVYTSSQNLGGFTQRTIDANNMQSGSVGVGQVVAGTGGRTLTGPGTLAMGGNFVFDNTIQFIQPHALNNVDKTRMIIGTNFLYESMDQGNTLTSLGGLIDLTNNGVDDDNDGNVDPDNDEWAPTNAVGAVRQAPYPQSTPIAYGGMDNGVANPDVLWVGAGGNLLLRTTPGGLPSAVSNYTSAAVGGGPVTDIVMDPEDWHIAYIVDLNGSVFQAVSDDAGTNVTFTNLTGNLPNFTPLSLNPDLRTVEFVRTDTSEVLLVGGQNGVYRTINPDSESLWSELGLNLPNAPVNDLNYTQPITGVAPFPGDVLAVGLFGRGVWTIDDASEVLDMTGVLNACGDTNHVNQDDEFILMRNEGNPLLLDVFLNNVLEFQGPLAAVQQINIFGVGGNDTLIVDSSNGLINVPEGIRYDGDGQCPHEEPAAGFDRGIDTLQLIQTDGVTQDSHTITVGATVGQGISTIVGAGAMPGDVQTIFFEELEPIIDNVPAVDLFVDGATVGSLLNGANQITYDDSDLFDDSWARITIDGFEPFHFTAKQNVSIDAENGDDTVVLDKESLPTDLTQLRVEADSGHDVVRILDIPNASATSFESVVIRGGSGNDVLDGSLITVNTPLTLVGDTGNDTLLGGAGLDVIGGGDNDDLLIASPGDDLLSGDGGNDQINILGQIGLDVITVNQPATNTLNVNYNGDARTYSVLGIEQVLIDGDLGDDIVAINVVDNVPALASLPFKVTGNSPNASDRLIVNDDGLGDLVAHFEGPNGRSGSITVGQFAPVDYSEIERVDITPLNGGTGGTGTDGLGRLVVFDYDDLESNDSLANASPVGVTPVFISSRNINPGGITLPSPFPGVPGDADWYEFRPGKIGTFRLEVLFEEINTLANGRAGLPNGGDLAIEVYRENGTLIASSNTASDDESLDISMAEDNSYFLRVFGSSADAINIYDLNIVEVDVLGPQITSVEVSSAPGYNLFDPKPSVNGPTPLIDSITLNLRDLLDFDLLNRAPGDLYDALDLLAASSPEHYEVRGDHVGLVSIQDVLVTNAPATVGQIATATVELVFAEPLPDDRFSLTVFDSLIDPPGNAADGGTNANEPQDNPSFPSGDGILGGDFIARFTVDSRPEIASFIPEGINIDINGNFVWDPAASEIGDDATNVDLTFTLSVANPVDGSIAPGGYSVHDLLFAGKFSPEEEEGQVVNNGFDQLAAFGNSQELGSVFRWLIDTNSDGVINTADGDVLSIQPLVAGINIAGSIPIAGNFDGNAANGDEIGLYNLGVWALDTNRNFVIDAADNFTSGNLFGHPIVGDFDGNGVDDLGVFNNDHFFFDLSFNPVADANATTDNNFDWGFPGVLDRAVAADIDQDGIDDIGLWVPRAGAQNPEAAAEWYFLISNDFAGANPVGTLDALNHPFETTPFGNDLFAEFGNELASPLVGNFDPPVVAEDPNIDPNTIDEDPDFDSDGDVDGVDFLAWQRGYGMPTPQHTNGDANESGTVDGGDLSIWSENFGSVPPPLTIFAVATDESNSEVEPAFFIHSLSMLSPAVREPQLTTNHVAEKSIVPATTDHDLAFENLSGDSVVSAVLDYPELTQDKNEHDLAFSSLGLITNAVDFDDDWFALFRSA